MPVALLVPLERLDSSPFMIFRAQNDVDSENQQNCLIEPKIIKVANKIKSSADKTEDFILFANYLFKASAFMFVVFT